MAASPATFSTTSSSMSIRPLTCAANSPGCGSGAESATTSTGSGSGGGVSAEYSDMVAPSTSWGTIVTDVASLSHQKHQTA